MYEQIIKLLEQKKGQFRQISNDTGLDYDWLHQVSRGVIKDPGIKKMEILGNYLNSSKGRNTAA